MGESDKRMYNVHIEAKIHKPKGMKNQVKRERLISELEKHTEQLIVFHATMGYGKTVFMNAWKEENPAVKKAWYHLGSIDNDVMVFMEYLCASAACQLSSFSLDLSQYQSGEITYVAWEKMGLDFCEAVGRAMGAEPDIEEMVFVLDDFQTVTDEGVLSVMEKILEYLPAKVRIFIGTKGQLPGFVDRRVLEGEAEIVTAEQLAFTEDEAKKLSQTMGVLEGEEEMGSVIWRYTEGWPAGIMFIYLYLRQNRGQGIQGMEDMGRIYKETRIQEFLMYNLFRKLPYEIQTFLTGTSLLEYLSADVCNAVMGIRNSASILDYMIQEGLFIQKIEGKVQMYRYHSLFRHFLAGHLSEEDKQEKLNRIAMFFLNRGQREMAAEYAVLAGNRRILEKAVESEAENALEEGKFQMVGRWLEELERSGDELSAKNMVVKGLLYWKQGREDLGRSCLSQGKEKAEKDKDLGVYLFAVTKEADQLMEQGNYREASSILKAVLDGKMREYSRYWFSLAFLYAVNILNFKDEEEGAVVLYKIVNGKAGEKVSPQILEIKEQARVLLSLLRPENSGSEKWDQEWEKWFRKIPLCREIFCWKKLCDIQSSKMVDKDSLEDTLKVLKPLKKVGMYGLNSQILAGLLLYENGSVFEGGNMIVQAMRMMKKDKDRICFLKDWNQYRTCAMMYMMAESGGLFQKGVYHLAAGCFGPFSLKVIETGEEIKWRTKKAKECVALLIHVYPKHLTREEMLDLLWEEDDMPRQEVAALHNTLSSIRKSLSPYGIEDLIQYQDKEYFLKEGVISCDIPFVKNMLRAAKEGNIKQLMSMKPLAFHYIGRPYMGEIDSMWARQERSWFEHWMYDAAMKIGCGEMKEEEWKEAGSWFKKAWKEEPYMEEPVTKLFYCVGKEKEGSELRLIYSQYKEWAKKEIGGDIPQSVITAYEEAKKFVEKK